MSALARPNRSTATVPVQAVDDFVAKVDELLTFARELDQLEREIRDRDRLPGRVVNKRAPALPAHARATITALSGMSKPASPKDILDALTVLAGVYGPRGDGDIVASVGVPLIQVEGTTRIELYGAILALLRPIPGERPSFKNDYAGRAPEGRRFAPTLSEVIAEIQQQRYRWQWRANCLFGLPDRHAEIGRSLRMLEAT